MERRDEDQVIAYGCLAHLTSRGSVCLHAGGNTHDDRPLTWYSTSLAGNLDNFFFPGRIVLFRRSHRINSLALINAWPTFSASLTPPGAGIHFTPAFSRAKVSSSFWLFKKAAKSLPRKYSTRASFPWRTAHRDSRPLCMRTLVANTSRGLTSGLHCKMRTCHHKPT